MGYDDSGKGVENDIGEDVVGGEVWRQDKETSSETVKDRGIL